jgi:hypothetical protein
MCAEGLQKYARKTYGSSIEQAKILPDKFFATYLEIGKWHQDVAQNDSRETKTNSARRRAIISGNLGLRQTKM